MSHDWFRSWHGAPVDAKWRTIAKRAGVPTSLVVSFMWALLDRASQAEDRGSFAGADLETFADYLDCDEDDLKRIVTQCDARNVTCDGRFVSWEKRQPKREGDSSAERTRLYRERKKNQTTYDDVTQCDAARRNVTLDKIREDKNISTNVDIAREASPLAILSECMSETTARDLIAHRQKLRKPLTARAAKLLAKDFVAYGNPEEAAEMMIKNGWQGFHPTWVTNQAARAGPSKSQKGWGSLYAELNGYGDGSSQKRIDEDVPLLSGGADDGAGNRDGDAGGLHGDVIELFAGNSR
jgi:hypothetical protein